MTAYFTVFQAIVRKGNYNAMWSVLCAKGPLFDFCRRFAQSFTQAALLMKVTVDVKTCFRDRFDFFAHKCKAEKIQLVIKSEQSIAANEQM